MKKAKVYFPCPFWRCKILCLEELSHWDVFIYISEHHDCDDHAKKWTQNIDWMYAPQHHNPLFFAFSVLEAKNINFFTLFSMMQHPSLSHGIVGICFFVHIMIMVMFSAWCNQKFGYLWWAHVMKNWNWRKKNLFFRYKES